jgi:ATP:ADP antiporter, AAA family
MFSLKKAIASLTRQELLFVLFSMLSGFCIYSEYAIIRPASQSIFLSVFSAKAYPAFWLATVPLNFTVIYLYSRFLPRIGPLKMMSILIGAIMSINLTCAFLLPFFPEVIFFHFCWKDVYILLMFQQLWSMIHSTISAGRAKFLFGMIFGVGTMGGVLGSLVPAFLATGIGSTRLFLFTAPIYALLFYAYSKAYSYSGASKLTASIAPEQTSARESFLLIKRSRTLLAILLLVVFMQITVALIEYQFSHQLEIAIPAEDLRTAYCGKLIGIINLFSLLFQFIGAFLLVGVLGVRGSHFFIPLVLFSTAVGQWISPGFAAAAFAYIFTKSIDFSLFGVAREMLFVPLKLDEKFRAKAVIDVFAYRTSKAFASFLILGLQFYVGSAVFSLANYLSFAVFAAWLAVVAVFFYKYNPQENPGKLEA